MKTISVENEVPLSGGSNSSRPVAAMNHITHVQIRIESDTLYHNLDASWSIQIQID